MLEITNLQKSYGARRVLQGVDLTAAPGQIVGLLGANGAGKTTLISIVAGLRRADAGQVRIAGIDALRDPRRAAKHIGLALRTWASTPRSRSPKTSRSSRGSRGCAARPYNIESWKRPSGSASKTSFGSVPESFPVARNAACTPAWRSCTNLG